MSNKRSTPTKTKPDSRGRMWFWIVFLAAAGGGGYYFWQQQPPQQVRTQLQLLAHPNAKISSAAWYKLNNLFFTDWAAFYLIIDEVHNTAPISFLMEKALVEGSDGDQREMMRATQKPIYYKTDRIYCRTIGEAIMAIGFNEPKLGQPLISDWKSWWATNGPRLQSGEFR